ncbi:MAG: hypothetical protein ACR2N2_02955 [Acidimicrobiia bacterium]
MTFTQMNPGDVPKLRMCDATECWKPHRFAFVAGAMIIGLGIIDRLVAMLF